MKSAPQLTAHSQVSIVCLFVCVCSLLSHSEGFDFSHRGTGWESRYMLQKPRILDIKQKSHINCEYVGDHTITNCLDQQKGVSEG